MPDSPSVLRIWVLASRPKTLIAGASPVIIGGVLGGIQSPFLFSLSFLFSLLIQIGTNFANDYFDWLHGADKDRIGPARATTSGWISPNAMLYGSFGMFLMAFLISLPLVFSCGLWSLFFVLTSIAFGILYTGGPRPLGYLGFGDLLVLLYFGPVAVLGTYYVQHHDWPPLVLSLPPGLLACAILTANNLRDEETDRAAGKNTLVVRFGKRFGMAEYIACIVLAAGLPAFYGFFFPLLILLFSRGSDLLTKAARLLLLYTLFFTLECVTHL